MNTPDTTKAILLDTNGYIRLALSTLMKDNLSVSSVVEFERLEIVQEELASKSYSMAVLRLGGGDFDGIGQLVGLRDQNPHLKIVVLTERYSKDDVLAAVEVDANGCIPLDLGVSKLGAALKQVEAGFNYYPVPAENDATSVTNGIASKLSRRQTDILMLLKDGFTNKMIARKLNLAEGTVKVHLRLLFKTLSVRNRSAAAVIGAKLFGNALTISVTQ